MVSTATDIPQPHAVPKTRSRTSGKQHIVALVLLSVLIGLLYFGVIGGSAALKTNTSLPPGPLFVIDPYAGGPITMPMEYLATMAWSHFQLPIVDLFQGYGFPLIASQGVPVFPPEILTHLIFPNNYSIWNLLRIIFLAWGTYLLAASFDLTFFSSLAAGVAVSLIGFAPPNINVGMLNPILVLPFVLLSLRYLLDPNRPKYALPALGLTTSMAMLALSGFQEVLPLAALVIAIFTIAMTLKYKTVRIEPSRILWAIVASLSGLLAGAIGFLPTLQALAHGMGINGPTRYLNSVPPWWLATLAIPHINGPALALPPQNIGQSIMTLGTPFLFVVIVLPIIITYKHVPSLSWLVYPSAIMSIFGILGYADIGNTLHIFSTFPFNAIDMNRFLQFAWWLPWCLLLAVTITYARHLGITTLGIAFAITTIIDVVLCGLYIHQLGIHHLANHQPAAVIALLTSLLICAVFLISLRITRSSNPTLWATLVVVATAIIFLPNNLYPSSGNQHINSVGRSGSTSLNFFVNQTQLPTLTPAVNAFSPINTVAYIDTIKTLFPANVMLNHLPGTFTTAPTAELAIVNSSLLNKLKSLGVTNIVDTQPLPLRANILPCAHTSESLSICSIGKVSLSGAKSSPTKAYSYGLPGASPVIDPVHYVQSMRSNSSALASFVRAIIQNNRTIPPTAFLTNLHGSHQLATDPRVLHRSLTTESATIRVHSQSAGITVLREANLPGSTCSINNRHAHCISADGGLWTALRIPKGLSTLRINYVSTPDTLEFIVAELGLGSLAILWIIAAIRKLRLSFLQHR
jgi:hypothetical protein